MSTIPCRYCGICIRNVSAVISRYIGCESFTLSFALKRSIPFPLIINTQDHKLASYKFEGNTFASLFFDSLVFLFSIRVTIHINS